jgi:hypothetical protein
MTGAGSQASQTPNTSSTLSSGGAMSLPSSYTTLQSIGAATTDGVLLENTTAAASGSQQWSPRVHWIGQGWKTNSTAASQQVEWVAEIQPVQNTTNPDDILAFTPIINGSVKSGLYLCANTSISGGGPYYLFGSASSGCNSSTGFFGIGGVNTNNVFGAYNNTVVRENFNNNGMTFGASSNIMWYSSSVTNQTTGDTGVCRGAAGNLYISDGASSCDSNGALTNSTQTIVGAGAASAPALLLNGSIYTGGTGTTTWPMLLVQKSGTTASTWSTSGTQLGVNAVSGFAGNLIDAKVNGTSEFIVSATGIITPVAYATATNCSSSASPAVCGSAAAGAVAIPTGVSSVALVVNTSAVTANSEIFLDSDDSLTIAATTCNSTLATLVGGLAVTARTAGTSFTITYNGTIATNPLCVSYHVIN